MGVGQAPRCVQRPGFNPQVSPHGTFHGRSGTRAGLSLSITVLICLLPFYQCPPTYVIRNCYNRPKWCDSVLPDAYPEGPVC